MSVSTKISHFDLPMSTPMSCDVSLARPVEPGTYPGVLILMDAFGPRPYLYDLINRIAAEGFIVLLPNLLFRSKRAPIVPTPFPLSIDQMPAARDIIIPLARGFNTDEGISDVKNYLDALASQAGFNGKVAAIGYCLGGSLAIRAAAAYPDRIQSVGCFHAGQLATEKADSPHGLLDKMKAHVYVAHADADSSMPPGQIELFDKAIKQYQIKHPGLIAQAEVYAGAPHGYVMADLPMYHERACQKHWGHVFELLKKLY